MTQEEKELLLKDLCARLPYGIFVKENRESFDDSPTIYTFDYHPYINNCKPYLRPMSSMTEEELKELAYKILQQPDLSVVKDYKTLDISFTDLDKVIDWLNSHYFDYRGLIPMSLALKAPKDMYKKQ